MIGLDATGWSAIATWLTFGVLGGTAWIALAQVRQARTLREEEARPVVVVDFDIDKRPGMIYLYLENFGRTSAHDVCLVFDPPLKSTLGEYPAEFFSHTFPTLPPGKRIDSFFDSAIARLGQGSALPSEYKVVVTYKDRLGREHSDPYRLDIESFRNRTYASEKDMESVVKALEDIGKSLLGIKSPYGGIKVVANDESSAKQEHEANMAARFGMTVEEFRTRQSGAQQPDRPAHD